MGNKGTYQGQKVDVVRAAKQGDKDFDAAAGEQVIVKLANGNEKTVRKSEVTETPST